MSQSDIHTEAVSFGDLSSVLLEKLRSGGEVVFSPKGISMLPLLRQGRDRVVLTAPPETLGRGDIPFYFRQSGQPVLHRIVDIAPDGTYILCGDNQIEFEHGVSHAQVFAVVKGIYRDDKYISCGSFTERRLLFWANMIRCKRRLFRRIRRVFPFLKKK